MAAANNIKPEDKILMVAMKRSRHEERKQGWKETFVSFAFVFILVFAYAFLRYVVFQGVGMENLPLYILNKAVALASVILIGSSFLLGPLSRFWQKSFSPKLYLRKYLGVFGFGMAALHGAISMLLLGPAYYPRFFSVSGKLTMEGELSMLFGFLSIFIFAVVAVTSLPSVEKSMHKAQWKFTQRLGYIAFFMTLLHVFVMGYRGWLKPEGWPGGMLPISLLAFTVIAFVMLMRLAVIILNSSKNRQ